MNFMVILIIAIVIFVFGVRFISKLSSKAADLTAITVEELDKKISDIVCEGSDRICIGTDRKTIQRGKLGVFGVKIININENDRFEIAVTRPDPSGYKKNNEPIPLSADRLISKVRSEIKIPKNEEATFAVGIEVKPDAIPGTYIFNVEIKQSGQLYVPIQKLYVDVP